MQRRLFAAAAIAATLAAAACAYAGDGGIRVATDSRHYATEQAVSAMTITVTNRSGETVYLSDLSFEQLELRKGFGWVALENPMRGIRAFIAMELKPGESQQHTVDCFFLPDRPECLGRRTYRIAAVVYSGCPGVGADQHPDSCQGERVVYSNTFTVQKDT